MIFSVALLQIAPCKTREETLEKGMLSCRKAKEMGASLALFPEMFSCGYFIPQEKEELNRIAVSKDSPFVTAFSCLARELDMAIGITYLEAFSPAPRNTLTIFDRFGKRVLHYAKVHTCDFGDERVLTPGDDFPTATLSTEEGEISVGAMICYDREFPESARILMLRGAEIILVPNACPMEINRLSQLRGRAYENMLGIATCNYPAAVPDCNGHSSAFDGVAYLPELSGSRDTCILEAGEEEGIFLARFDLARLRAYRNEEVHGNAYRRPTLYTPLTKEEVLPPFIRTDRRK